MTTSTALRIGVAAAALLVLSSCTSDADWAAGDDLGSPVAATDPSTAPAPEWLFAIQSDGDTTFDASTGRLSMPAGSVHAFTDRPYRDTKITSPHTFVDLWQRTDADSFREDPPNAVLTYWEGVGDAAVPTTVVCEITGDVGYSGTDRTLSMGLRVLEPKGVTLPPTMSRASLFVDDVAGAPCEQSPSDESNVEYFNEMVFEESIDLVVELDGATNEYQVRLECPERPSPTIPSSEFDIQLTTSNVASTASCYSNDTISVPAQDVASVAWCNAQGLCTFEVIALNSATEQTYSRTQLSVRLTTDETILPQLDPATIPICDDTVPSGPDGLGPIGSAPTPTVPFGPGLGSAPPDTSIVDR